MGVTMIDDDQDDVLELDTDLYADPIAARTAAYTSLFRAVMQSDGDMREEGMRMLSRVRCSFKAPTGELSPLPGGKP